MMIRRACMGLCISVTALGICRTASAQEAPPTTPTAESASTAAPLEAATAATVADESSSGINERIPAFKELFTPFKRDLWGMASRQHLVLAGVGLAGAFTAHPMDRDIARTAWGASSTNQFFGPGKTVGSFVVQTSAAFATYFVGRAANNSRVANVGARLVRAQIAAQTTTQAIKFSVQRRRPDGTTLSFPSGHTSSAFATATVLNAEFGWKAGLPAYAMAAWVGVSRMEGNRHYLSDVVAGATIGILAGRSVTIGRGPARFSISPMAAPGGIGVNFVQVGRK